MENSESSAKPDNRPKSLERANSLTATKKAATRPIRRAIFLFLPAAIPFFIFAAVETLLKICGFGYATTFFVRSSDGTHYESNREFGRQFFSHQNAIVPEPVQFPVVKASGTFRIFILGESAAVGTPDPSFGFGRILEVMLDRQYPKSKFEVVNAAMRGINSAIVAQITEECVQYEPDLLILYMGNNELVEFHTSTPGRWNFELSPAITRLERRAKSTRTGQWIQNLISRPGPQTNAQTSVQNMAFFRERRLSVGDKKRDNIYANFRENLEAICAAVSKAHRKLLVSTISVNLKDCPPLGSLHRRGLTAQEKSDWDSFCAEGITAAKNGTHLKAVDFFERALKLDDTFAELHFRIAQCYQALGDYSKTLLHFEKARDCDALQFRADGKINETIRTVALNREADGIRLVDTERAFNDSFPNVARAPGEEFFFDHVHLNFSGDYLVARSMLPAVSSAMELPRPSLSIPTKKECAELLAFNQWEEWNTLEPMTRLTAGPPFLDQLDHTDRQQRAERLLHEREKKLDKAQLERAAEIYRQAIERRPDDWQLHYNFGYFLRNQKAYAAAAEEYRKTLLLFPNQLAAKLGLGLVCLDAGKIDEAIEQFSEAIKIDPHSVRAWQALARAAKVKQQGASAD